MLQHMCSDQLCRRQVLELVFTSYLDKTGPLVLAAVLPAPGSWPERF